MRGSVIDVEDVSLPAPKLGWNTVTTRIRNLTGQNQTCMVTVEVIGGFWFQGKTRVFRHEIAPMACETFKDPYLCPFNAKAKVRMSVSAVDRSCEVEQSVEGEPVAPSGAAFVHRRQGSIEIYAQKGGFAEANAERILAQRVAAVERICSFLGVQPVQTTLVLYEKPEEKTFDTGHLGAGLARGTLAVEVCNADMELQPYHEIVHVQARAIGDPPAFLSEGLAVYLEEELGGDSLKTLSPYPTIVAASKALKDVFWSVETLFGFTAIGPVETRPEVSYPEAASLVKYLVTRFGKGKLLVAYRCLQNSDNMQVVERNRAVFREVFGLTLEEFECDWRASL